MLPCFFSVEHIDMSFIGLSFGTADKDLDRREKKAARKTTQAGGSGTDLEKIATEQQAKLQKEREERKAMFKQQQAEQAAQTPDTEAELPVELTGKPQTSQNPKEKPETKPKAKPKSVSKGMKEESKEEESKEDESKEEESKEKESKEQESKMKETPRKAHSKYDGSEPVVKCEQHLEPVSLKQGEQKKKKTGQEEEKEEDRTLPLIPETVVGMSPTNIFIDFYTILP